MPPIFTQKSSVVALLMYATGAYFHAKGRHVSSDDLAGMKQAVGGLFDIVASNVLYYSTLHAKNVDKIAANKEAIKSTAEQTSAKLTDVSDAVNAIIDPNQTPQLVPSPVEVRPPEKKS